MEIKIGDLIRYSSYTSFYKKIYGIVTEKVYYNNTEVIYFSTFLNNSYLSDSKGEIELLGYSNDFAFPTKEEKN